MHRHSSKNSPKNFRFRSKYQYNKICSHAPKHANTLCTGTVLVFLSFNQEKKSKQKIIINQNTRIVMPLYVVAKKNRNNFFFHYYRTLQQYNRHLFDKCEHHQLQIGSINKTILSRNIYRFRLKLLSCDFWIINHFQKCSPPYGRHFGNCFQMTCVWLDTIYSNVLTIFFFFSPFYRVLKPPGGGSSDIFGGSAPSTPRSVRNNMASNIFAPADFKNGNGKRPSGFSLYKQFYLTFFASESSNL